MGAQEPEPMEDPLKEIESQRERVASLPSVVETTVLIIRLIMSKGIMLSALKG